MKNMKAGIHRKNPTFVRQDAYNIKSLKIAWRKPRGMHSKVRMSILGHRALVKVGYRNPASIRHTFKNLPLLYIHNSRELEAAPQPAAIILAANLSRKKKAVFVQRALEKKLVIANLNPEKFLEKFQQAAPKKTHPEAKAISSAEPPHPAKKQPLSEKEAEAQSAAEKRKLLEKPK